MIILIEISLICAVAALVIVGFLWVRVKQTFHYLAFGVTPDFMAVRAAKAFSLLNAGSAMTYEALHKDIAMICKVAGIEQCPDSVKEAFYSYLTFDKDTSLFTVHTELQRR